MDYKVVLTEDAETDIDRFIAYLIFEKKSGQAANNLQNDFEATRTRLSRAAENFKLCDNPRLKELGYRMKRVQSINRKSCTRFTAFEGRKTWAW